MKTRACSSWWIGVAATVLVASARAGAQEVARLSLSAAVLSAATEPEGASKSLDDASGSAHLSFAKEGSHWGTVGIGATKAFTGNATGINPTFSYSYFLIDGVEVAGELGGWYYNQKGPDAVGVNPCAVLRWHFWRAEDLKTTVYFDAGIGVALFSNQVPNGGTSFDFTPRFGFGLTRQITDDGLRLQLGLRWNHVSNARILGDHKNPSRDGPLLYFGLIFPF